MISQIVISVCLILFFSFNYKTDYKFPKQFVLNCIGSLLICWKLFEQMPLCSFLVLYMLISSSFQSHWAQLENHCTGKNKQRNWGYLYQTSTQFIDILILSILFIFYPSEWLRPTLDSIPYVTIVGTILTFMIIYGNSRTNRLRVWGYSGNPSVNSTFMSILAIASLQSSNKYMAIIGCIVGVIGAIKSYGSVGIFASLAGVFTYLVMTKTYLTLALTPIILLTSPLWWSWSKNLFPKKDANTWYEKIHPVFSFSGREQYWKMAVNELYKQYKYKWFGIGSGSFIYSFPMLQLIKSNGKERMLMVWLHNDILQFFIEHGPVGSFLLALSCSELIYKGHNSPEFMALAVCMFVNSLANFPNKMAPDMFVWIISIKSLLWKA